MALTLVVALSFVVALTLSVALTLVVAFAFVAAVALTFVLAYAFVANVALTFIFRRGACVPLYICWCYCLRYLRDRSFFSKTLYEVRGQLSKRSDMTGISKKILIQGLRGIKCQKLGVLDIFSETGH